MKVCEKAFLVNYGHVIADVVIFKAEDPVFFIIGNFYFLIPVDSVKKFILFKPELRKDR